MKGRLISFAAATVFAGSALTALAAEGALTIREVMRRCIFSYGSYTLGSAAAYGDYEICNFDPAKGWV